MISSIFKNYITLCSLIYLTMDSESAISLPLIIFASLNTLYHKMLMASSSPRHIAKSICKRFHSDSSRNIKCFAAMK